MRNNGLGQIPKPASAPWLHEFRNGGSATASVPRHAFRHKERARPRAYCGEKPP